MAGKEVVIDGCNHSISKSSLLMLAKSLKNHVECLEGYPVTDWLENAITVL